MTTQHTPGPWIVLNTGNPERGSAWRDVCSMGTEFTPSYVGEALEHDARLIAAAPELLAALQQAQTLLHSMTLDPEDYPVTDAIHAAIAKATGETA